jgi:hypothetical protein
MVRSGFVRLFAVAALLLASLAADGGRAQHPPATSPASGGPVEVLERGRREIPTIVRTTCPTVTRSRLLTRVIRFTVVGIV